MLFSDVFYSCFLRKPLRKSVRCSISYDISILGTPFGQKNNRQFCRPSDLGFHFAGESVAGCECNATTLLSHRTVRRKCPASKKFIKKRRTFVQRGCQASKYNY